jgi:hypothetical protein
MNQNLVIYIAGKDPVQDIWSKSDNQQFDVVPINFIQDKDKFTQIRDLAYSNSINFSDYKYILMLDADVFITAEKINELFQVCEQYKIKIASPAIANIDYPHSIMHKLNKGIVRFVNWIDLSCVVMSYEVFNKLYYFFGMVDSIEFWKKTLEDKKSLAIIDKIEIYKQNNKVIEENKTGFFVEYYKIVENDLSICIIYHEKDSEYLIDCLQSLPFDSQVIMVKTVPTEDENMIDKMVILDRTEDDLRIRGEYYYQKKDEDNIDNWSKVRQTVQLVATKGWILSIDADERLNPVMNKYMIELLNEMPSQVWGIQVRNYSWQKNIKDSEGNSTFSIGQQVKIFRNIPQIKWDFATHEVVGKSINEHKKEVRDSFILIQHIGYAASKEEMISKMERNLAVMFKHPEDLQYAQWQDYMKREIININELKKGV